MLELHTQFSFCANADIQPLLQTVDCLFYLHCLKWRACVYELFVTPSHTGRFSVSHHFPNLPYNSLVSSDSVLIFSSWFPGNHHRCNLCNHHSLYEENSDMCQPITAELHNLVSCSPAPNKITRSSSTGESGPLCIVSLACSRLIHHQRRIA